jgi:hypothetical protein
MGKVIGIAVAARTGHNQALEIFSIKLVGVDVVNGKKLLITIAFIALALLCLRAANMGTTTHEIFPLSGKRLRSRSLIKQTGKPQKLFYCALQMNELKSFLLLARQR